MNENKSDFFKKYGFEMHIEKPHPKFKDTMKFSGLEADYVSKLEHEVQNLNLYIRTQNDKIDNLMNIEIYKYKKELDHNE